MKLSQYFHLRDTRETPALGHPNYDPLFKVRTFLDIVSTACRDNYNPDQRLSIDEGMIGFKGIIHFRQYMPAKPTKWGIKCGRYVKLIQDTVLGLMFTQERKQMVFERMDSVTM